MELIQRALESADPSLPIVRLRVDGLTFLKRRWRGVAEDGREFGFDLAERLRNGAVIFVSAAATYVIEQKPEPVLEVAGAILPDGARAARLGWMIGNLHFPIEVTDDVIRVADDPAVRQMFDREGIPFTARECVFHPMSGGHRH